MSNKYIDREEYVNLIIEYADVLIKTGESKKSFSEKNEEAEEIEDGENNENIKNIKEKNVENNSKEDDNTNEDEE